MRSEPGGEVDRSGGWGPRDWCASGVGGESFDLAPEPSVRRPGRARRSPSGSGAESTAERAFEPADEVVTGLGVRSAARSAGPVAGRGDDEWAVEAKGEQQGERPDWVVDAAEGPASTAEPVADAPFGDLPFDEPPFARAAARSGAARAGGARSGGARGGAEIG
ncbi:hypothetical protein ACQRUO_33880, partial [Kitasatospora sp. LaBMicrA B282]